jgi:hypothetical protein
MLLQQLEDFRAPLRDARTDALTSGRVDDVLADGNRRARTEALGTMEKVREAIGL